MNDVVNPVPARLGLRAGDWVVVRSREEILATLDEHGHLKFPVRCAYVAISPQVAATALA